jgi:hypothetical protein
MQFVLHPDIVTPLRMNVRVSDTGPSQLHAARDVTCPKLTIIHCCFKELLPVCVRLERRASPQ